MSKIIYSVGIDCGRTDLANVPAIGFYGGGYYWSTSDREYHAKGIIDEKRISSFGAQCNITYGGEVSSPTSELVLDAVSSELLAHIAQYSVRLVGKMVVLEKSIDGGSYEVERKAPVEALEYDSNTSVRIVTKQANLFGASPLAITIVNEALLLGVDSLESGLVITKSFGDHLEVPLTRFTNSGTPAFATAGIDAWVDKPGETYNVHGLRDLERADDPVTATGLIYSRNGAGKAKVKHEAYVQAVWNNPNVPSDLTRVLLNHNGDASWVVGIMPQFVGGTLRVVRGPGSAYGITAVETKTYGGLYGDWCVLNKRCDDSELAYAGAEDLAETSDEDPYVGAVRPPRMFGGVTMIFDGSSYNEATQGQQRLREAYVGGLASPSAGVTTVVLGFPSNVYMAPIAPGCIIVGVQGASSGSKKVPISIPTSSIRALLQDDQYALLQIIPSPGSTTETEDNIIVGVREYYKSYVDNSPQGDTRLTCTMWSSGNEHDPVNAATISHPSALLNNTQLSNSAWILSNQVAAGINSTYHAAFLGHSMTSVFTRIDAEGSVVALAPGDDSVSSVYPLISLKCTTGANWLSNMAFTLNIRCHAISETGISMGYKEIFWGIDADGFGDTAHGEYLGGAFQIEYFTGDHTNGTEMLRKRIEAGLDMREYITGATGDSAKYLYTQIVVAPLLIDNSLLPVGPVEWNTYVKAQGVGMGVSVSKANLKLIAEPTVGYPVANPADLLKQVIASVPSVTIDPVAFAAASADLNAKYLPHGNAHSAYYTESNDTAESIISNIAKGSGLAVVTSRDNVVSPRVFVDDYRDAKTPKHTFGLSDVIAGSLRISRPGTGFMCTDYTFETLGMSGEKKRLTINTAGANSYPSQSEWEPSPYTGAYQCQITDIVEHGSDQITVAILPTSAVDVSRPPFIVGVYYLIRTQTTVDYGTICEMEGMYYNNGWKLLFGKSGMLDGGPLQDLSTHAWVSNISVMRQQPKWKYLVSSNLDVDYYLLGRNLWEIAARARDYTQTVIQLPSDYAKISQPLWTTAEGFANHMLYTVAHTGYAKTLIEFEVPINIGTSSLYLLDYVRIEVGPYAANPTFGWIVSWDVNPERGTYTYKILTAVSDEDTMYLDENHTLGLNAQMVIDESVTGSIIDEGVI